MPSTLSVGTVLIASIQSIEDKGAVMDLGLSSQTRAFLSATELPPGISLEDAVEGQTMLVSVLETGRGDKRVFQLSGKLSHIEAAADIGKSDLMPGMIVTAQPLKPTPQGLFVTVGNGVKAFVNRRHLPARYRDEKTKMVKPIQAVITYAQANSNILGVNALPEIVALANAEKRTVFEGVKVGDTVTATVSEVTPMMMVYFELPAEQGRSSLTVFARRHQLQLDKEATAAKMNDLYSVGTPHHCRVLDYRMMDRLLIVSNKTALLDQKMVSVMDAKPGDKVKATVQIVRPSGIYVKIYDHIRGFIPQLHSADKPKLSSQLDKFFKTGQEIKCRLLYSDEVHDRVVLTHKQGLVESKGAIVTGYDSSLVGSIADGFVVKTMETGVLVAFYNRVKGFLHARHLKRRTPAVTPALGSPIRVKILSVDAESEKMQLGLPDSPDSGLKADVELSKESVSDDAESSGELVKKSTDRIKGSKLKQFNLYTATVVGPWTGKDSALCVELFFPGGQRGRIHASELADSYTEGANPLSDFLAKNTNKKVHVKVIGFFKKKPEKKQDKNKPKVKKDEKNDQPRFAECTLKASKLGETKKKKSLLGYDDIFRHGQTVPVFVNSSNDQGVHVEANPQWKGKVSRIRLQDAAQTPSASDHYAPGQVYHARIVGVDKKHKRLELSLAAKDSVVRVGEPISAQLTSLSRRPLNIALELPNGQRATIGPCELVDNYSKLDSAVDGLKKDAIYRTYPIVYDEPKGRWIVSLRPSISDKTASIKDKLITSVEQLKVNERVRGVVYSNDDEGVFVHLGPTIIGRLNRKYTPKQKELLQPDAVVTVTVKSIIDGKIGLQLLGVTETQSEQSDSRKRTVSASSAASDDSFSTAAKKSRSAGFEDDEDVDEKMDTKVALPAPTDPGFDWAPEKYAPASFATIGLAQESSMTTRSKKEKQPQPTPATLVPKEEPMEETATPKEKKTKKEREIEREKALIKTELKMVDRERDPESAQEFDRLIAGAPNASELWMRYIAFFLQSSDVEKARQTADRALKLIHYREEEERFNIWTALLNLEIAYGTEESLKKTFERAVKGADALKVYKQMVKIYQNAKKIEEADNMLEEMLKKFKQEDLDVWLLTGQHYMDTGRPQMARDLMQRALKSIPKTNHVQVISRFAQMEYRAGDSEQGKTLFESILSSYPRKTDVWSVYIDMVVKHAKPEEARPLFERVTTLNLGAHKMRFFFKKWLDFEQRYGNEDTVAQVKERAIGYVQDMEEKMTLS
uniref:S1 motif domain-containing protein n=1 Tax=Plectus sambesii TaxID=2011161 RepID=A0A914VVE1_9BILA